MTTPTKCPDCGCAQRPDGGENCHNCGEMLPKTPHHEEADKQMGATIDAFLDAGNKIVVD